MSETVFRLLVVLTALVTVAGIIAEDVGSRRLPEPLRSAKARMKADVVAASAKNPAIGAMRVSLVLGYLISLLALAFFVPFGPWLYLFFTMGWSALAAVDAPHILPRSFVPLYEASLLLNGATLALCFLSPIAARFAMQ